MGKIVLLDDLTINQIAAGEVIERPASVVKELVENSIDAGAKNITVDIKNGGISYIRVIDDGSGIMQDDMEIAFERHATSKIRKAEDLDEVKSMGFRGEALASISAISKMEIVSKTKDSAIGYKIRSEGGKTTDMHEEGCSKGTTITVKELFFNTPVRYKFLKKDFTELGYIEEAVKRIALANPSIAIKLLNSGKTIIQTNGTGNIKDCIYDIYGKEIFENIIEVDYQYEDYHVSGVIGKPIISRSNRTNQLFFVNKRFVKDKTLTSSAEQGFKGLVTIGKHGFLILNIDMDSKKVDVNVHPTKLEVRFQEEQKVFKAVLHAIKETLLKGDLISEPVKDYSEQTPNDMLKGINNRDRVEAWNLNKENAEMKDMESESLEETKSEGMQKVSLADSFNKPEFTDFKSTIANMDKQTREKFINGITSAKTSEEIYSQLTKFNELMEKETNKEKEDKNDEKLDAKKEELTKSDNESNDDITEKTKNTKSKEDKIELKEKKIDIETKEENKANSEVTEKKKSDTETVEEKDEENNQLEYESINEDEIKIKGLVVNEENEAEKIDTLSSAIEKQTKDDTKSETNGAICEKEESTKSEETVENLVSDNGKETQDIEQENIKETESEKEADFEEMYKKLFGRDIETAQKEFKEKQKQASKEDPIKPIGKNEISIFEQDGNEKNMPYTYIGIVFKTYIILSIGNEMYIMDQHAAHERIMYEKVKANYYNDKEKDSQMMLLPDIITLNNKEMGIFRDNKAMFNKAGFVVEEFGDNTVKLTGVPEFCLEFDTKEIFLETLDEIDTVARTAKQEVEDKFLATVACKAAVKANMALSKEEVDSLMEQLLKLPNPFSCPHGRPTVFKISKTDIEKKFSRR